MRNKDTKRVNRNTIANRLSGSGKFSIDEAFRIQKTYFRDIGLEYLFEQK